MVEGLQSSNAEYKLDAKDQRMLDLGDIYGNGRTIKEELAEYCWNG